MPDNSNQLKTFTTEPRYRALTSSIILSMKQIKVYSYCITHNIEFLQRTLI